MEDTSVTNRAYQLLRADLINCQLRPGSRLNMSELQERYTLSQASVREALSRLTAEGLVIVERNRGYRVAEVSLSGFREIMEACIAVQQICMRSAIINGDREWELNLLSAYHRAMRVLDLFVDGRESFEAYSRERLAFYEALMAACTNKWLLWSWAMLYTQLLRYRHMYLPLAKFEQERQPDHFRNLQAVLDRDVDRALEMALENEEIVIAYLEELMAEEEARLKSA